MNNNSADTYTVKDISRILNLSRTATYEFINSEPPFRVLRINTAIRSPKDSFDNWFHGTQEDTRITNSAKKGGC